MDEKIIAEVFGILVTTWGIVMTSKDHKISRLKDELVEFKKHYNTETLKSKLSLRKVLDRQKIILHQNKDLRTSLTKTCHDLDEKLNDTRLDIARLNKR